jgi:hypothetical protein
MDNKGNKCLALFAVYGKNMDERPPVEEIQEMFYGVSCNLEYTGQPYVNWKGIMVKNRYYKNNLCSFETAKYVNSLVLDDHLSWIIGILKPRINDLKSFIELYAMESCLTIVTYVRSYKCDKIEMSISPAKNAFFSDLKVEIGLDYYLWGDV